MITSHNITLYPLTLPSFDQVRYACAALCRLCVTPASGMMIMESGAIPTLVQRAIEGEAQPCLDRIILWNLTLIDPNPNPCRKNHSSLKPYNLTSLDLS